jgi:hypothetical protein
MPPDMEAVHTVFRPEAENPSTIEKFFRRFFEENSDFQTLLFRCYKTPQFVPHFIGATLVVSHCAPGNVPKDVKVEADAGMRQYPD